METAEFDYGTGWDREHEYRSVSIMMRNIAIGLATAAITMGASTLSASSGVGKGSMGWTVNGHRPGPLTHGLAELTPHERMHLRANAREHVAQLPPRERERLYRRGLYYGRR